MMPSASQALPKLAFAGMLLILTTLALAQSGGNYELSRFTVVGGEESSGGDYALMGIAGQPEAGSMSGGSYVIEGGFLPGAQTQIPTAVMLLEYLLGRRSLNAAERQQADVNHDGKIDVADLIAALNLKP